MEPALLFFAIIILLPIIARLFGDVLDHFAASRKESKARHVKSAQN
jgi:hypothetical protein